MSLGIQEVQAEDVYYFAVSYADLPRLLTLLSQSGSPVITVRHLVRWDVVHHRDPSVVRAGVRLTAAQVAYLALSGHYDLEHCRVHNMGPAKGSGRETSVKQTVDGSFTFLRAG